MDPSEIDSFRALICAVSGIKPEQHFYYLTGAAWTELIERHANEMTAAIDSLDVPKPRIVRMAHGIGYQQQNLKGVGDTFNIRLGRVRKLLKSSYQLLRTHPHFMAVAAELADAGYHTPWLDGAMASRRAQRKLAGLEDTDVLKHARLIMDMTPQEVWPELSAKTRLSIEKMRIYSVRALCEKTEIELLHGPFMSRQVGEIKGLLARYGLRFKK